MKLLLDDNLYYDMFQLMIYTTFMERTVFLLDLDRLEMARTLIPNLDQGGNVQTVLDWVGGELHDQQHEEALFGAGNVVTLH